MVLAAAAAAAKLLQSCLTLCDPETAAHQAPPSLGFSRQEHWSGLHFLLQCVKVKSESEVAQSCPTPSDPMVCSPPDSSVHEICQARVLEWMPLPSPKGWCLLYCKCYITYIIIIILVITVIVIAHSHILSMNGQ